MKKDDLGAGQWQALWFSIWDDVGAALRLLRADDSQFGKRTFIRTAFATIEGIVACIKHEILQNASTLHHLSPSELAILREEVYSIDNKGKVFIQPRFIPIDVNVRFTLDALITTNQVAIQVNYSAEGWRAFKSAVRVRNRITHPNVRADFEVSGREVDEALAALKWIEQEACQVLEKSVERLRDESATMTEEMMRLKKTTEQLRG